MRTTPRRVLTSLVLVLACTDDGGDDELGSETSETTSASTTSTTDESTSESSTSESTSDTSDTSETSESSTSDTSDTSDTTSDSETTSTTGDGDGDAACPIGEWPYADALCGPDDLPCTIATDEQLDGPAFRNGAPALAIGDACQVHVLFSVAEGGYHGYYATNDAGWTIESTPMDVAVGGLVVDPVTQVPTAVVDDGAFGVTTWVREGGWAQVASFAGMHHFNHGLVRGLDGVLHAAYRTDADALQLASYEGMWTSADVGMVGIHPVAAVSRSNIGQLSAWVPDPAGWQLYWHGDGVSELVADYGSNALEVSAHAFSIIGGDETNLFGTPHLLHTVFGPPYSLAYSTRSVVEWSTITFAPDTSTELCDSEPLGDGQQCNYDFVRHHPLALVTSENGHVRLLWTRIHHQGTLTAQCEMGNPPFCAWTSTNDTSSGELWIGWPSFDTIEARLLGPSFAIAATAGVDTSGRIHLAVYDLPPGASGSTLRHLRLEP
jgi:hypothetical protein